MSASGAGASWTVSHVRSLQPGELSHDAERLDVVKRGLEAQVDDVRVARRAVADAWEGDVSTLALARIDEHASSGDALVLMLVEAAIALRECTDRLLNAQTALFSAVATAEAAGCDVQNDGTCLPPTGAAALALAPTNPPSGYVAPLQSPNVFWTTSPERMAAGEAAAAALAEKHTREVKAALRTCEEADLLAAARLAAVDVPEMLADEAATTVQQVARLGSIEGTSKLQLIFGNEWTPSNNIRPANEAHWLALVLSPLCTAPLAVLKWSLPRKYRETTMYVGGGVIEGPDGRDYPLVIPHVYEDGKIYGADLNPSANRVEDLDGADAGWTLIGQKTGTDTLTPISGFTKGVVAAAVLAGAPVSWNYLPRRDLTESLKIGPDGVPYLPRVSADPGAGPGQPFADPRDNPVDQPSAGRMPHRGDKVGGVMEAITNGGEAALAHQRLENSEDHLYSLRLEENEDGRRRALLQTFEVFENPSPKDDEPPFEIRSTYGYWDAERDQVVLRPFNFRGERDAAGFKDMPVG